MSLSKLAKKTAQTAKNIGETLRAAFRGKITLVVSSEPIQRVQLSGLADETLQDLEHLQEYGFASHPPDGSEAVVIPLGGNTSHGLTVSQIEAAISNVDGVIDRRLTAPTANRAADTVNRIEWFKAGAINVTEMPS